MEKEILGKIMRIEFEVGFVINSPNGWLAETKDGAIIKTTFRTIENAYKALTTGELSDL
jgi:hypothetical protein